MSVTERVLLEASLANFQYAADTSQLILVHKIIWKWKPKSEDGAYNSPIPAISMAIIQEFLEHFNDKGNEILDCVCVCLSTFQNSIADNVWLD